MEILRKALAGTHESSDAMILVEPMDGDIEVLVESPVILQFGSAIRKTVLETARRLQVKGVRITVQDHGALDFTLRARLECALLRAASPGQPQPDVPTAADGTP